MSKFGKKLVQTYKETKKSSILVYLILRGLVIFCMVRQILRGDFNGAFLCILSLILFTIPGMIKSKLKITLPSVLEIIIYLFIFSAEILGEIYNFYGNISNWDLMLHTINGFLCAAVGFSLVDLLNESNTKLSLSPIYVSIVAFCFSMTVGVCWEFFEYTADNVLLYDMQKDTIVTTISTVELDPEKSNKTVKIKDIDKTVIYNKNGDEIAVIEGGYLDIGLHDTMEDLFVNLLGATTFSIIGYFYIKNRDKYKFAEHFIPVKDEQR